MELKKLVFISLIVTMVGCGGSDEQSPDPETPVAPTVTILVPSGSTAEEQTVVTLDATTSGATAFTFAWTADNESITIIHEDASLANASFTAPEVRTSDLAIVLTLTATTEDSTVASTTRTVTISPVNALPEASTVVTQDSRFEENTFGGALPVIITGSGTDSDPIDSTVPISAYLWEQLSGTDVTENVTLNTATLTFTTPELDITETLLFNFTVTDNEGGTDVQPVSVTVLDITQTPPIAEAGDPVTIMEGERFLISASATALSDDADPFSFEWSNASSDEAVFGDAVAQNTYAQAPAVSEDTTITLSVEVTDQFGNEDDDDLLVTVRELPISLLNDTGVLMTTDAATSISGTSHDFPGQDGDLGRDRIANGSALEKAGEGVSGFDYTKLDSFGDEIDFTETDFDCIRDNVTGLIWEVKTDDDGLHDRDHTYSWFSTDGSNGGLEGTQNDAASCNITNCNTESFVTTVNAEGLCGFFDWRLPTHNELMSIMNYSAASDEVLVDTSVFPLTSADNSTPTWYWTAIPNSDGTSGDAARSSWAIDFSSGNDNFLLKSTENFVRLVRAGR